MPAQPVALGFVLQTLPGSTPMKNADPQSPLTRVRVRALARTDWPLVERLFGRNGACGGCWCMWWRVPRGGKLWEQNKGEPNRRAFRKLVTAGRVTACIALDGDEPVGWCCIGPRMDFPRLERVRALQTDWDERTWSVVCFFVRAGRRGQGIGTALLREAVRLARRARARRLEGYPVRPSRAGARIPAAFAWTGTPELFTACGFHDATPPGNPRPILVRAFR